MDSSKLASAPPGPAPNAREWAYDSWNQGGSEGVNVSLVALQKLLDEVAHLRSLAFAVENRLKVTVESTPNEGAAPGRTDDV